MKAMRPAAAIASTLLASLLVLLPAGCGNFWQNPNGTGTSTGTTPTTTNLSPSSSSITAGSTVTLSATVSPTAATGTVTFYSNGISIGTSTLSSGAASYTPTFTTAGTDSLTATYSGDNTYETSTSTAVTLTVTASGDGAFHAESTSLARVSRETNLVLDPANAWTVDANTHLHNIAIVVLNNRTVENIDGGGHCVYYSGKAYIAPDAQTSTGSTDTKGVYELSGGGHLAPEGTVDPDCE
jgi:hypothetical protein